MSENVVTITMQAGEVAAIVAVLRASDPLGVYVGPLARRIEADAKRQIEARKAGPPAVPQEGEQP